LTGHKESRARSTWIEKETGIKVERLKTGVRNRQMAKMRDMIVTIVVVVIIIIVIIIVMMAAAMKRKRNNTRLQNGHQPANQQISCDGSSAVNQNNNTMNQGTQQMDTSVAIPLHRFVNGRCYKRCGCFCEQRCRHDKQSCDADSSTSSDSSSSDCPDSSSPSSSSSDSSLSTFSVPPFATPSDSSSSSESLSSESSSSTSSSTSDSSESPLHHPRFRRQPVVTPDPASSSSTWSSHYSARERMIAERRLADANRALTVNSSNPNSSTNWTPASSDPPHHDHSTDTSSSWSPASKVSPGTNTKSSSSTSSFSSPSFSSSSDPSRSRSSSSGSSLSSNNGTTQCNNRCGNGTDCECSLPCPPQLDCVTLINGTFTPTCGQVVIGETRTGQLFLKWLATCDSCDPITKYTIYIKAGANLVSTTNFDFMYFVAPGTHFFLTPNIGAGTCFSAILTATNSCGESLPSEIFNTPDCQV